MVDVACLDVPEVDEIDLRTAFAGEATAFTRWLARPDNLAVGIDLEPVATEVSTGTFRVDLIARNPADDGIVVIRNQFGRCDHDHLGEAPTYLAASAEAGARSVKIISRALRSAFSRMRPHLCTPREDVGPEAADAPVP